MENKSIQADVILSTIKPTNYVLGVESGAFVFRSVPDWSKYLPDPEPQNPGQDDSLECATFSGPEHSIEAQINYDIFSGNYSQEALDYFTSAGYMMNGKFRCSSLFNAKMNGTTQQGNTLNIVAQSAHTVGLLPWSDLPMTPSFTWAQYSALVINPEQISKAKKILDYVLIQYQWITTPITNSILSKAPVQIATPVCAGWFTDTPVKSCQQPAQHATMVWGLNGGYQIRDTYTPWDKVLSSDYVISEAMQYIVKPMPKYVSPYRPNHKFNANMALSIGARGYEVREYQRMLAFEGVLSPRLVVGNPNDAFFGTNTYNATIALQNKYKNDILVPAGLETPTGRAGWYTLTFLNNKYSHPNTILDAQVLHESWGNDNAIGDLNIPQHAYGCLQIRQGVCDSVNSVLGTNYRAQDCWGNRDLSIHIWTTYYEKCYPQFTTDEDIAMSWNGGSGFKEFYNQTGHETYTSELNIYWSEVSALIGK